MTNLDYLSLFALYLYIILTKQLGFMNTKRVFIFLSVFFILILIQSNLFAQGCSQCKMLSDQASEVGEDSFGTNINWGILYLMIIPYILLMFLFRNKIKGLFKQFGNLKKK